MDRYLQYENRAKLCRQLHYCANSKGLLHEFMDQLWHGQITGPSPSLRGPPRQWCGHTTINPWTSSITLLLYTSIIIYLVPHFRDVLGNFMCYIRPQRAPEDRILAVVGCRKWSDNLRNHAYSCRNGSMAFVVLACYCLQRLMRQRPVQPPSLRIDWKVTHNGKV